MLSRKMHRTQNNFDDLFKDSGLFKYMDEKNRVKSIMDSNKSVCIQQVVLLEKQTIFLTNAGKLYG
jgi:hypothetical protein